MSIFIQNTFRIYRFPFQQNGIYSTNILYSILLATIRMGLSCLAFIQEKENTNMKNLDPVELIATLAFNLVADQLVSPGPLTPAVQRAFDDYQAAVSLLDQSMETLQRLYPDEQDAWERFSAACDDLVHLMFRHGFALGRQQGLGKPIFTDENISNLH